MSFVNQTPKEILDLIHSSGPPKIEEIGKAVKLPGTEEDGYSAVYRNKTTVKGLISVPHPSVTTTKETFDLTATVYPNSPCLGTRKKAADGTVLPYLWETYEEVSQKALHFGAGLFFN